MKKIFKKENIEQISLEIIKRLILSKSKKATLIALDGDLGVGKTTITKEIAKQLGVKGNIISPTFVVMKIYNIPSKSKYYYKFKKLIHIDAYRIENAKEFIVLGWKEIIKDKDNLIILEWPENIKEIIPKNAIKISLSHKDEDTREVVF